MARCKVCDKKSYGEYCFKHKPSVGLHSRKPMNRIGRVGKQTAKAVAKWKSLQRPNHQGYHECYMCGVWVPYLEAEHVKSRARHPGMRVDFKNLKPVCAPCNEKKGSKDN